MSRGILSWGDFVPGGFCPEGFCPGDFVRGGFVRGDFVLIPACVYLEGYILANIKIVAKSIMYKHLEQFSIDTCILSVRCITQ